MYILALTFKIMYGGSSVFLYIIRSIGVSINMYILKKMLKRYFHHRRDCALCYSLSMTTNTHIVLHLKSIHVLTVYTFATVKLCSKDSRQDKLFIIVLHTK
jgi:hypothetical protein